MSVFVVSHLSFRLFRKKRIMAKNEILDPIKELAKNVDITKINRLLQETDLHDFEMQRQTIYNIAEWCLNGNSDQEIRKKLSLNKGQWLTLVACCPTLLVIMSQSRELAEVMVAGSLFQTAIGGKVIHKQQLVRVHDYDKSGKVIGEHIEKHEVEEELPPNPLLLRYLAEKKLNEKLGANSQTTPNDFKDVVDGLSKEEVALIESMKKAEEKNGN